jgi:phage terminase large subunit-like protein
LSSAGERLRTPATSCEWHWFEELEPERQADFLATCREDLELFIRFVFGWDLWRHQPELIAALQALIIAPECWLTPHPLCQCPGAHVCDACFLCRVHDQKKLLNIEPPGWGKSDTCIEFCAWVIGRDPEFAQYAFLSYNDPIANERSQAVRDAIWAKDPNDVSERFALVFPDIRPDTARSWAADRFYVRRKSPRKDPTFVAAGIHGSVNARRLRGLVLDDPINQEIADSPTQLASALFTYDKTIKPRLVRDAWQVAIMTPWAEGDIAMTLKTRGWPFLHTQALDTNDRSTCEAAKSTRELHEARADNQHSFMLLYMGEITPKSDRAPVRAPSKIARMPTSFAACVQSWDTAEQAGPRNAETVGVMLARGNDDVPYLLDVWCGQPSLADQPRICDEFAALWERKGLCPKRILIEKKSTGGGLLQLLERYSPYRHLYKPVEVGGRGHKQHSMIEAAAPLVALVKMPYEAEWADKVIQQCGGYPYAKRDDILMALCHGLTFLFDQVYDVKPIRFERLLY